MKNLHTLFSYAIALNAEKFKDKHDRAGNPYILHCLHVMYKMPATDVLLRIIAVCHDLIEDTDVTIDDLRELGYPERVLTALTLLTHDPAMPYDEYIKLIATNKDAIRVKLADLDHNSRATRLKGLREKDHERIAKYHRAFVYLSNALANMQVLDA
jgi:(p)ppGpp synthase/HD superfamily hydrolase